MTTVQLSPVLIILAYAAIAVLIWNGIKVLAPLRRAINKLAIADWASAKEKKEKRELRDQLMNAATANGSRAEIYALLEQATPKLLGVLQTTAISILEARKDEKLIRMLTAVEKPEPPTSTIATTSTNATGNSTLEPAPDDVTMWIKAEKPEAELEARDRLEVRLERRLDALQATLDHQWSNFNKAYMALVAAIVGALAFYAQLGAWGRTGNLYVVAIILIAAVFSAAVDGIVVRRSAT